MTGFLFNIRQRRSKNEKTRKNQDQAATDAERAPSVARKTGTVAVSSDALVACIPCPALMVDADRKISALNEPFCRAFGVRAGFYHVGEDFADFARRASLSGCPGLLAVGDLLSSEAPPRDTEIVARTGAVYEARACQTADAKILITLSEPSPSENGTANLISREVVRNMPGAVLSATWRPGGSVQCLYANNLSLELLGMGLREITEPGFDFRNVIAEPQRHEFEQSLERSTATSEPFDMEFQVKNAASGRRWVRCQATVARDSDDAPVFYLRMVDIEDRRRVAEERRQLQVLLDMVVDNIPFMVNVKNAHDRTMVVVNRAFEETTGMAREDVIGQRDLTPYPEWDWDNRKACYERLLKTRRPVDFPESTVETRNKGKRILKSRKFPLVDEAGQVDYILSITEDITERRNTENALRRSEQLLRDAIESLADGVALFDAETKMVLCNTRYRMMWPGHEAIAVTGTPLETLVRGYLETAVAQGAKIDIDSELKTTLERHGQFRSSRDIRICDGRWFQVSNHPAADGGFAITCTDITALKEREESLRKASRQALSAKETAEDANRSKSDFLANMSHELRTPLNAVIGFSEIIKEALLGDHSIEPYRGYAQDIHDSGTHLLSLINDILDMSKIEAGKLELFEEHIDLADAVEASLRLVRERAHQNNISMITEIPDDLPRLNGDLRKFKQITINLLSNAVKFTPRDGTITTRLYIGEEGDLYLQITDTGIGIGAKDLEKVLEPFGQAETGLNRQYEGTGLGLTLTNALTRLHGGRLDIQSKTEGLGRGTTVTVIFPASRVVD